MTDVGNGSGLLSKEATNKASLSTSSSSANLALSSLSIWSVVSSGLSSIANSTFFSISSWLSFS